MTIDVDPDWWKTLFDEVYLLTDARSVDNQAVTRREVNIFTSLVPIQPHHRVLDLCGGHGRHALELCRRGIRDCTVLDYSQPLLDIGAKKAADANYEVTFVQGDARDTQLPEGAFDHVFILGNSLGYIQQTNADLRILQESRRLLKSRGWLLLDIADGEAAQAKLSPMAWHEIGEDVVVCRQREVMDGCVRAREMVLSKAKGIMRDNTYRIRLYRKKDLTSLAARAGFESVQAHCDAPVLNRTADVGCMNHRLVVTARKP
jgi:D-alanine-D-alanine ligase